MMYIDAIGQKLPQRYPFLFVDRILEITPGEKGRGIKYVTANEPYFQGHFPGEMVMPGVLIVEACGQLAGLVKQVETQETSQNTLATSQAAHEYLAGIHKFHFKKKVIPGDALMLEVFQFKQVQKLIQVTVQASVEKQLVAEGILILTAFSL